MRQFVVWSIGIIMIFVHGGCASIVAGKMQEIPVTSDPEGAMVRADDGTMAKTPGTLILKRNKSYTVVADHNCCGSQEILLNNKVSNWFWANAIFGGGIGMIIDASSGASDELFPKKIHFDFSPEALAKAHRRAEFIKTYPEIKKELKWAISNGIITKKMTREMVIASVGEPDERMPYKKYERFVYNNLKPRSYYFNKKDILTKTGKDWFFPE